jgi:hypothetical protein
LGAVAFFRAGVGVGVGAGGFNPSDIDDDEVSWVAGIIVPGLRFLENVEDFWGTDRGGAATTGISGGGEDTDGLRSVRRRLGCVASDT